MTPPVRSTLLGAEPAPEGVTVARNLSTRYLAIAAEAAVGLLILPFNLEHLGHSAYGLWTLTASVTAYFSVLDLGYSGALLKFVAEYRAKRDVKALNETLSTTFCVFAACAALMYVVAIVMAIYIDRFFNLAPDQVYAARIVLLVTSVTVAAGTAFSVFGAVINGFQRYHLNNITGTLSGIITAAVNVIVLLLGYGLIELVIAMTTVRVLTLWVYRANAYRVFPGLQIRASLFSRARLRQVTGLSVPMAIIDWANKLNFAVDAVIIGMFMTTTAVAVWAIGQRLADLVQRLASQLNDILFPAVVQHDTTEQTARLQAIFIQGTRLSLAIVIPLAGTLILLAEPLVYAWVGRDFSGSVPVLQLLCLVVIVRVGNAMAITVLKGTGRPGLVAYTTLVAAVCNIALSVATIGRFGLQGVALSTLVPVCLSSLLVVFPAGCRQVRLSLGRALMEAVWPAVWPAAVTALFVLWTRPLLPVTLPAVGGAFLVAAILYVGTFLFAAVSRDERRLYFGKLLELFPGWRLRPISEGV